MIPPPGPPARALRAVLADLVAQMNLQPPSVGKYNGRESKPFTPPFDLFADEPQTRKPYDESRALADEEFDEADETDEDGDFDLPSAPRPPLYQRPEGRPFNTAPPLSALQKVGQLLGKLTSETPPPPPLPDGTPVLRKPVTMTTESLQQIAAIKNDEGISFVLDVDLAEFDAVRKIIGVSTDSADQDDGDAPAEAWRVDTLTVRAQASGARGNLASISAAKKQTEPWEDVPQEHLANMAVTFNATVRTVLWAEVQKMANAQYSVALIFQTKEGTAAKFALTYAGSDYPAWREVADALKARNERLIKKGFPLLSPWPSAPPGLHGFNSSPVNGFAVGALARMPEWKPDAVNGYTHALYQERADKDGYKSTALFGIRGSGQSTANMGELLAKRGPVAVKAWYGLWARWSEEGSCPSKSVVVELNVFCDVLGYVKHHNGGHRIETKREAVQILDFITQVEMMTILPHHEPKKRKAGKVIRLSGRIWERGILAEEGYADLFGQAGVGEPNLWEPVAFRYRPGEWFSDPDFRARHARIGYIGEGLLQLANDKDQWAILIGGYLGWKGDIDKHTTRPLRAETILQAVGLAQSEDMKRRAGFVRGKFERALDRLRDVGVIEDWTWAGVDVSEPDDMDDPDALATYAADTSMVWKGSDWRRKCVLITWPEALSNRGQLRQAKRDEHVKTAKTNAARLAERNAAKQMSA